MKKNMRHIIENLFFDLRQSLKSFAPVLAVGLALLVFSFPAVAGEFVAPTVDNILKILVRFGALNMVDDRILDDYAKIIECKLYRHFYSDDFRWKEFRDAMRKSIKQNIGEYPTGVYYDAELQLDRYDFKQKIYKFREKSSLNGVDYFTFVVKDNKCGKEEIRLFPTEYRVVLDQPLLISGIPLSENDAKTLLKRMKDNKNDSLIIYARFNFQVVFVDRLSWRIDNKNRETGPLYQSGKKQVRLDARLGSIDFFEDETKTRLIYSYRP